MRRYDRFWDRIAERYARQPVADEAAYQQKLRKTREYFRPDSVVFEFGCGTGSTAINHAPYVGRILAIDVSPKMIEIARGKAQAAGTGNVTFEAATIDAFEAADESYDVVMAHSILHLLEDRDGALRKAHAMLMPGGVLVSSTMCLGDRLGTRIIRNAVVPFARLGLVPWLNSASSAQLKSSIEAAGFAIEHEWRPDAKSALFLIAGKI